jgi:hypothetical protein
MFDYAVAIDWIDLILRCRAIFTIEDVCWDQWNWVSKNPYGYQGYPADSSGSKVHRMELLLLIGPPKKHLEPGHGFNSLQISLVSITSSYTAPNCILPK